MICFDVQEVILGVHSEDALPEVIRDHLAGCVACRERLYHLLKVDELARVAVVRSKNPTPRIQLIERIVHLPPSLPVPPNIG